MAQRRSPERLATSRRGRTVAQQRLFTSSTKTRSQFLREELLGLAKHADLNLSQTRVQAPHAGASSLQVDAASREAVEAVGSELVRRVNLHELPEGEPSENRLRVLDQIVGWLAHEVRRIAQRPGSYASSDMFVFLSWTCGLYVTCVKMNLQLESTPAWEPLIGVMATLVNLLARWQPNLFALYSRVLATAAASRFLPLGSLAIARLLSRGHGGSVRMTWKCTCVSVRPLASGLRPSTAPWALVDTTSVQRPTSEVRRSLQMVWTLGYRSLAGGRGSSAIAES
ncbi:hypothetical protein CERSUDRAFT_99046 [Gelatoporia subvermispora B]|uniref:Uncharacterized protein n=1 Tax=Ceriporiopsis subvermispora (strain B) TaxID=914234 RepID=M2R2C2_CERS8|nr:hypothetical protein CERSUDRAFT_99046 [Gelatoporia subvermispora B]